MLIPYRKNWLVACLLICLQFLVTYTIAQTSTYSRVKIKLPTHKTVQTLLQLSIPLDCSGHYDKKEQAFIGEFSTEEIQQIKDAGLATEIMIQDVSEYYKNRAKHYHTHPKEKTEKNINDCLTKNYETPEQFELGSMGGFFTYQEMLNHLDNMFLLYPHLISNKAPINDSLTVEGRPIYWLRISDTPTEDTDEPEVLYTAIHHAREPVSMSQLIFYMYYLLENYETDPAIKNLVDHTELYFIPCINPDGYIYNETTNPAGGGLWRKNRHPNEDGSFGIDLNRNYGYEWANNDNGSSPNPPSNIYRGDTAFSEIETQAIRDFCIQHEFKIALNYHAHGNLLIYPWAYSSEITPDNELFRAYSKYMTAENRYLYGTIIETLNYTANGDSDDWMYGEQTTKNKILALTPEIGLPQDGFWPSPDRIIPLCQENVAPNLTTAQLVGRQAGITDQTLPYLTDSTGLIYFDFQRLGLEDGNFTVTIHSLTDGFILPDNAIQFNSLDLLEKQSGAFDYNIADTLAAGTSLTYELIIDNGLFTTTHTFTKIFQPTLIFSDDITTKDNWSSLQWDITTATSFFGSNSLTDSPTGDYENNQINEVILNQVIDLSDATDAIFSFWAKWDIEANYDYVKIEASTDSGNTWTALCGQHTKLGSRYQAEGIPIYDDTQLNWVKEELSLIDFLGEQVWIKISLVTDGGLTKDGFYIDQVHVVKTIKEPLAIRLFLEAPYIDSTNEMSTTLTDNQLLPLAQPFNQAPWQYSGTEKIDTALANLAVVVDWVLVELRDTTNQDSVIARKAGLLRKNGWIMGVQESGDITAQGLFFQNIDLATPYHIVVRHRNHLAVLSKESLSLNNQPNIYDFTQSVAKVKGEEQLVALQPNVWGLRAGDIDGDGTILVNDLNILLTEIAEIEQYLPSDSNLDGNVTVTDYNGFVNNSGTIGVNEIRYD